MRLSCRRRSQSSTEDILSASAQADEADEELSDESILRERQCQRRMAVVLDWAGDTKYKMTNE